MIKNLAILISLLVLILFIFLSVVSYNVIKPCDFYVYDSNKYFVITKQEKKYIKSNNQRLNLEYKNENITIYINTPKTYDDYYLYDFYCLDQVEFDYGLNHALTNFGKEKC
jgi:hypothetical protein